MKKITAVTMGLLISVGGVLFSSGCRSAYYEVEAEGLQADEAVTAVAVAGVPGGALIDTIVIQAKVLDINLAKGEIKLLIPGGEVVKTRINEDVDGIDKVRKGDIINAVITEELVFQLVKAGTDIKEGAEIAAAMAEDGQLPAGMVAAHIRISATIKSIDTDARTVTLSLDDGKTKTIPVRDDIGMEAAKAGDQVVIDMFEAILLNVEHPVEKK